MQPLKFRREKFSFIIESNWWLQLFVLLLIYFILYFMKHNLQNKKRLTNALEPINVMKLIIIQYEHVSLCSAFHVEVSQGTL